MKNGQLLFVLPPRLACPPGVAIWHEIRCSTREFAEVWTTFYWDQQTQFDLDFFVFLEMSGMLQMLLLVALLFGSLGGLVVAAILKLLDNIVKVGFSTGMQ